MPTSNINKYFELVPRIQMPVCVTNLCPQSKTSDVKNYHIVYCQAPGQSKIQIECQI